MPAVSVVISAYNYADYTVQAVESVLAQTYRDFEVIVVDDGSTDGTGQALQKFGDNIRYIYKQNGGVSSARNLGIKLAKGKYIAFLDCDDLWLPNKIEETLKGFTDDRVGLVYTDGILIDAKGDEISELKGPGFSGNVFDKLLISNFINNPSVVVLKKCFESVGLFDEDLFYAADWDMWLRISEKYKIMYLAKSLSKYRIIRDYRLVHAEEAKADSLTVLKKARKRNPDLSRHLKRKALSEIYFDMFYIYKRTGSIKNMVQTLISLIFIDPGKIVHLICLFIRKGKGVNDG